MRHGCSSNKPWMLFSKVLNYDTCPQEAFYKIIAKKKDGKAQQDEQSSNQLQVHNNYKCNAKVGFQVLYS